MPEKGPFTQLPPKRPDDRVPGASSVKPRAHPAVALRLQVEELLDSREGAPARQWKALGPKAVDLLVEMAESGGTHRLESRRDTALQALALIGDDRAAPSMRRLVQAKDIRTVTRAYAMSALAACGGPRDARVFRLFLDDENDLIRGRALKALSAVGTAGDLSRLAVRVADEPVHALRLEAFRAVRALESRLRRHPMRLEAPVDSGVPAGRLLPIDREPDF